MDESSQSKNLENLHSEEFLKKMAASLDDKLNQIYQHLHSQQTSAIEPITSYNQNPLGNAK